MKKIYLITGAAVFALSTWSPIASSLSAKEESSGAQGSIRPTGKVKKVDRPGMAKISFDAALQAARGAVAGDVVKAELEVEDGNLMYSFEIVGADKSLTEVEIDAGNGKVLDVDKEAGPGGEKKEKKKDKD